MGRQQHSSTTQRILGCAGVRIESAAELKPALEQAFASKRHVVIDCPVDYNENLKLTEKLGKLVCPI